MCAPRMPGTSFHLLNALSPPSHLPSSPRTDANAPNAPSANAASRVAVATTAATHTRPSVPRRGGSRSLTARHSIRRGRTGRWGRSSRRRRTSRARASRVRASRVTTRSSSSPSKGSWAATSLRTLPEDIRTFCRGVSCFRFPFLFAWKLGISVQSMAGC